MSFLDIFLALRHTYFPEVCPLINDLTTNPADKGRQIGKHHGLINLI